jgi:hypothetical protein
MSRILAKVSGLMPLRYLRSPQVVASPSVRGDARAATSQDIGLAIRFLSVLVAIGTVGAIKLAITSQMQQTAVALDHARSEVQRSEIRRERLLMERSMLRQPGRLQAAAVQLGLEAPVAVIDVPAAAK